MGDRQTALRGVELIGFGVKASTSIEAGKMVAIDATGYAVPASDAANLMVVGMADEAVDNSSGASGDKTVLVRRGKAFLYKNDATHPVAQAHMGQVVYVKDASTVDSDGGTYAVVAGRCVGLETGGVWVETFTGGVTVEPDDDTDRWVIADPGASGAIPVGHSGVCALTTTAAQTRTIAVPAKVGDIIAITLSVDGGNATLTAASAINQTGNNTAVFDDAGDTLTLIATRKGAALVWRVLANDGVTLSTV